MAAKKHTNSIDRLTVLLFFATSPFYAMIWSGGIYISQLRPRLSRTTRSSIEMQKPFFIIAFLSVRTWDSRLGVSIFVDICWWYISFGMLCALLSFAKSCQVDLALFVSFRLTSICREKGRKKKKKFAVCFSNNLIYWYIAMHELVRSVAVDEATGNATNCVRWRAHRASTRMT